MLERLIATFRRATRVVSMRAVVMRESKRDDVALTNFIADSPRGAINASCEIYVKWWYGGAFNGAAWLTDDGGGADAFFYRDKPIRRTGLLTPFSEEWLRPTFIVSTRETLPNWWPGVNPHSRILGDLKVKLCSSP